MIKIIDISVCIDEKLPLWPGTPAPKVSHRKTFLNGDGVLVSDLSLGLHSGTHVDAPSHHIENGKHIHEVSLDAYYGDCLVIDMRGINDINASVLENKIKNRSIKRLLFKTDNSKLWQSEEFTSEYTALTKDGSDWLAENDYLLVGIDYLSIQRPGEPPDTHLILLRRDVVILEGICLHSVSPGEYKIACQPLNLKNAEASPVRAILIKEDS